MANVHLTGIHKISLDSIDVLSASTALTAGDVYTFENDGDVMVIVSKTRSTTSALTFRAYKWIQGLRVGDLVITLTAPGVYAIRLHPSDTFINPTTKRSRMIPNDGNLSVLLAHD